MPLQLGGDFLTTGNLNKTIHNSDHYVNSFYEKIMDKSKIANGPGSGRFQSLSTQLLIAAAIIGFSIAFRVNPVEGWPNFNPVSGLALFGGLYFRNRISAIIVPLVSMLVSDAFLGGYEWGIMLSVYVCMVVPAIFGGMFQETHNRLMNSDSFFGRLSGFSGTTFLCIFGIVNFFLVTNFAYWVFFEFGKVSLFECYVKALPFVKNQFYSDLGFAMIPYCVWQAAIYLSPAGSTKTVGVEKT